MPGSSSNGVWRWVAVALGTVVIALLAAGGQNVTGRLSATEQSQVGIIKSQSIQDSRLTAVETNQANILRIAMENSRKLDKLLESR